MSKKNAEKKKRTRGLWTGLFLLAVSAGFVVWCGLWGLARVPAARPGAVVLSPRRFASERRTV